MRAVAAEQAEPLNAGALDRCGCTARAETIAGLSTIRVEPSDMREDRLAMLAHGGAYVTHSAQTTLFCAAQLAQALGCAVVNVDYPLAPEARWRDVVAATTAVARALGDEIGWPRLVLAGESAGGGLVAGVTLRLRDEDGAAPGAVLLASPWTDLTETGDTRRTLAAAEPAYVWELHLAAAAAAYAPVANRRHPFVSPVYGDFAAGFPPTLIQAGTREILLSDAVRLASAIRAAGGDVELDLYDGMTHVFHLFLAASGAPEALGAYANMRAFVDTRLGTSRVRTG